MKLSDITTNPVRMKIMKFLQVLRYSSAISAGIANADLIKATPHKDRPTALCGVA